METISTLLWELRKATRWSLGELARRSGVSKAALSQWESGARTPRIPELEATLHALQASEAQRRRVLAAVEAPRALRLLRQVVPDTQDAAPPIAPVAPPTLGDMLSAMRHRKGWTQERLADALKVSRAAVTRWERGERLPSKERVQEICYALDAHEEEIVALTVGRLREGEWHEALSSEEINEKLNRRLIAGPSDLDDLLFWRLERQAWELSTSDADALPLLAHIYTHHATHYSNFHRWSEISALVEKSLAIARRVPVPVYVTARCEILRATAAVYGAATAQPRRGAHLLSSVVKTASSHPEYQAWALSDLATYLVMDGRIAEGLEQAAKAIPIAERANDPAEASLRRLDYSRLLLRTGRPAAAMDALPLMEEIMPASSLVRAEAEHQLGRLSEAANALQQAMERIKRDEYAHLRPLAADLARRF